MLQRPFAAVNRQAGDLSSNPSLNFLYKLGKITDGGQIVCVGKR